MFNLPTNVLSRLHMSLILLGRMMVTVDNVSPADGFRAPSTKGIASADRQLFWLQSTKPGPQSKNTTQPPPGPIK